MARSSFSLNIKNMGGFKNTLKQVDRIIEAHHLACGQGLGTAFERTKTKGETPWPQVEK